MSSDIALLPQVWHWYYGFFVSMGSVFAVAVALAVGVLLTHWLYLCSRRIELKPTPSSYPRAMLRLSGFQALIMGAVLVPFITIAVYYLLFFFIWKLAPAMPSTPPTDVPFPDFGSGSTDEWFSSMASLVIYIVVLTVVIVGTAFFLLRNCARRINEGAGSIGIIKRVVRRYFHESVLIGFLLALIACPVLFYFLYNMAWLVMYLKPSAAGELPRIAFPGAESIYMRSLEVVGYCLIIVLFIPTFWLLLRGLRLRWRYTIENPIMKLIFTRSVKFSCLGLFAYIGCIMMYFMADSSFRFIVQTAFR